VLQALSMRRYLHKSTWDDARTDEGLVQEKRSRESMTDRSQGKSFCEACSIRSFAISAEGQFSDGGVARHCARYWTMDHSEGMAIQGQTTA
jgi:hypothetical protein